jgi:hypothetical protein
MTIWWLALILVTLGSAGLAVIWLVVHRARTGTAHKAPPKHSDVPLQQAVDQDVEHIFNADFREELRNRGRLHFEKIIGENAMFLQQDLQLTTSQLNEYMKTEITNKLKEEFNKYEQSIMDAKQLAIESIQKTNDAIDEQRQQLSQTVQQEILAGKQQTIKRFETNMADIINHYVMAAVGNQIDLSDQLEYILGELEANKAAIVEDINSGA